MAVYKPLFVYLTPASIPQVVAHIQKYLADNPIVSDPEAIAEAIQQYIEEHPEIIAVASVNGKTGNVVLTGSDININASSAVSVETQLLNLASMISTAGADITQIEANISQIYTTIGTLQTNVETNASNISALQTSVEGQGTRIATAEGDIDALESAQSAQNTRLNSAEGNISSLQTRMTQAETDIDSNESNIGTLQTNVQTIQTYINSYCIFETVQLPNLGNVSPNSGVDGTYTLPSKQGYTAHVSNIHIGNTTNPAYGLVNIGWSFNGNIITYSIVNGAGNSGQVSPSLRAEILYIKN